MGRADGPWLTSAATTEEAAALLAELVAVRSLVGEEGAVQERVAAWLAAAGLSPEVEVIEPGRPNVTVRVENGEGPTLLLNGHVDTAAIDPRWDPARTFGVREGDKFVGLGAGDMKSGVVAALLATRALAEAPERWAGTLIFSSVIDEEAYSKGAHAVIARGDHADFCVVTESAWEQPCLGAFGKLLVRADVTGKAAHASWPHLGVNAAVEAARFVARLNEVPLGQHPRIAPSRCVLGVRSGQEGYQSITVPDRATVLINWHTVPGERAEEVLDRLRALVARLDSPAAFTLAIDPPTYPAWETPVDAPIARAFARAYEAEAGKPPAYGYWGYGDPNLFSALAGIPTVMVGPRGGNFHEAEEWVDLPSIPAVVRVLLRLAVDLMPPPEP